MSDAPEIACGYDRNADRYDDVTRYNRDAAERLVRALPPEAYRSLLDVGCGTGFATMAMAERFAIEAVTGVDISAQMLGRMRAKLGDLPQVSGRPARGRRARHAGARRRIRLRAREHGVALVPRAGRRDHRHGREGGAGRGAGARRPGPGTRPRVHGGAADCRSAGAAPGDRGVLHGPGLPGRGRGRHDRRRTWSRSTSGWRAATGGYRRSATWRVSPPSAATCGLASCPRPTPTPWWSA